MEYNLYIIWSRNCLHITHLWATLKLVWNALYAHTCNILYRQLQGATLLRLGQLTCLCRLHSDSIYSPFHTTNQMNTALHSCHKDLSHGQHQVWKTPYHSEDAGNPRHFHWSRSHEVYSLTFRFRCWSWNIQPSVFCQRTLQAQLSKLSALQ